MTNNTDLVRALIADWRESAADTKRYSASDYADGYAAAESNCANRLEAALASAPPSAPVGVERKELIRAARSLRKAERAIGRALAHQPAADFDAWQKNPDTKVLMKSIAEDYVPKHDQQPAAPSGEAVGDWVLVPRKPTLAMANAAWRDLESQGIDPEGVETPQVWDAMLAAAPQQPAAVDEAAAIRAFEEHFQASSDDPYFEGELELWITAWRKALATQHQEPTT